MIRISIVCILFLSVGVANMLTNGDFEQELTVGWSQSLSSGSIGRTIYCDPDADYEAILTLNGAPYDSNYTRLYQTVEITTTDLVFALRANLHCNGSASNWGAAAVMVSYLDYNNHKLGCSIICHWLNQCPWSNDSTTHLIEAPNNEWASCAVKINDELSSLPGINPDSIEFVEIALLCLTGAQRC